MKIWKYTLDTTDYQLVNIKAPAKILSVDEQYENIVLYAEVDDSSLVDNEVGIWIHGTGHEKVAPETAKFIGTVKLMGGQLMFHVYAEVKYDPRYTSKVL